MIPTRELEYRIQSLRSLAKSCNLCPRNCKVDRIEGSRGVCGVGPGVRVARVLAHHGEEPPLVSGAGSGTVFFSGCTLRCVFCQNHRISQEGYGEPMQAAVLAEWLLQLQSMGCVNINLVTPTPHIPWALEALVIAREGGLTLPIVYNTSGYESLAALQCLEDIVDIYLPDFKYGTDQAAERFSSAPRYPEHALAAIQEMYRQVGLLEMRDGAAVRGLIVRHLVLPENLARTDLILRLLAEKVTPEISLSLMAQYQPCYRAAKFPELNRKVTRREYEAAVDLADSLGFEHGWFQDLEQIDGQFLPDFEREEPFA